MPQNYVHSNIKYLDKNRKIKISTEDFEELVIKNHFYRNRIKTYVDSLNVIISNQFKEDIVKRTVYNQITYSWKRVEQHLWLPEDECKKIAKRLKTSFPYDVFYYFADNNTDPYKKKFMNNLRQKLYKKTNDKIAFELDNYNFLTNMCFKNNPEIKELKRQFLEKHKPKTN